MTQRQLKAAIYTRKSTERGLEQDFNSLAAQREAAEAYIKSQRSEGWSVVDEAYDDGGISGATMERPALQSLMSDVEAGRIDIIVVYKVDRLTRSLTDFAEIIKRLDDAGASFVSVTQQFNTSNSMGRLTLNVLLSFSQFEREITAERIRDKIAASKRKGMWMGGAVPLGYDNIDKKLVINEAEGERVRLIFKTYLKEVSAFTLKQSLLKLGIGPKVRAGKNNSLQKFSRGALYYILKNRLYIGEIAHKDKIYKGNHQPIIDGATWKKVQNKLKAASANRTLQVNSSYPSLFSGLLYGPSGSHFTPSHSNKEGVRYRYYISGVRGPDRIRYPAVQIEDAAKEAILNWINDPENPHLAKLPHPSEDIVYILTIGTPHEQRALCLDILEKLEITETVITAHIKQNLTKPYNSYELKIPITIERKEKGAKILIPAGQKHLQKPDPKLISLIAKAQLWAKDLQSGKYKTMTALANKHGVNKADLGKIVRLAYLAPDIIEAIIDGRQPPNLIANQLRRMSDLPSDWQEQRERLGFA